MGEGSTRMPNDAEVAELPQAFLDQMHSLLGDEYPAYLRAMGEAPALALRLNPRRAAAGAAAEPFVSEAVPWEPTGRYLIPGARPGSAIAHWAGAYYIQEASAMAPAAVLNPRPGERVLDLCAAPGGKSTQLAGRMGNRGVLVANDPDLSRARILAGNLERMGAANALVVSMMPDRLAEQWPDTFDAILVDAPCSGEGMFRRDPAARGEWSPAAPEGCARRQAGILEAAGRMLRPGGRLVYATCTLNRVENEANVEAFLHRHPDFSAEDFSLPGLGESSGGMMKLYPHRVRGDGHFVAKLRRAGDHMPERASAIAHGDLHRLEAEICRIPDWLWDMDARMMGDRLYAVPAGAPALAGLRVVTPGLPLVRVGRSHVEPQHALAMAIDPADPLKCVELEDREAAAYLSGEALPTGTVNGWTWVAWRGMPLGWGKVTGGTLKNHLPKGLRKRVDGTGPG